MIRRACAALLALMLNGGSGDPSVADAEDDAGSDSRTVGWIRDDLEESPKSSAAVRRGADELSRWRGDARASAPVKTPVRPISASVSIFGADVGVVVLNGVVDNPAAQEVLLPALSTCRERGDLKVLVLLTNCDVELARRTCEASGFTFSSAVQEAGRHVIELYTDIYFSGRSDERAA